MGILKRAGDLVYTFRFLRLLTTKFEDTGAYKLGIIDASGKRNKSVQITTDEQRDSYTPFHRLVFNIKKLLEKVPGGSTSIASYAAALYLLKEKFGIPEDKIESALKNQGYDLTDFMVEDSKWFVLDDGRLSPGMYKVRHSKLENTAMNEIITPNEHVKVGESCYPVGKIFGISIYEAKHVRSNQPVYITVAELKI